ncbi:hypothetical protein DFH09DRAFT_1193599 [Mycena vulgaris]|nr:hypothetical protein DFH09DRAFT_1193599 [Mycena vulgaris]
MESKLNEQSTFSKSAAMTATVLEERLHVVHVGDLHLKSDHAQWIAQNRVLGEQEHMASQDMHRHLAMLDKLVAQTVHLRVQAYSISISPQSEAAARSWIDTLFFRAAAMVPADNRIVLRIEHPVPSTQHVDHTKNQLYCCCGCVRISVQLKSPNNHA